MATPPSTARASAAFCSLPSPMPMAIGMRPTNIAPAVMSTGRNRVSPAIMAASLALAPVSSRCSRAKVTNRMELALATPTDMIVPISEGMENVVCVMKRLSTMPQKASGRAARMTNGSPQLW